VPELRTVSDLAHALDISRQRLHRYAAGAEPVRREGTRLLYDAVGQARILSGYLSAQLDDANPGYQYGGEYGDTERRRLGRLFALARELDILEDWRQQVPRWFDSLPVARILAGLREPEGGRIDPDAAA
jgi:hypothetical protein